MKKEMRVVRMARMARMVHRNLNNCEGMVDG